MDDFSFFDDRLASFADKLDEFEELLRIVCNSAPVVDDAVVMGVVLRFPMERVRQRPTAAPDPQWAWPKRAQAPPNQRMIYA